jgi:uroporphyrinogen-III synthase
VDTLSSTSLAGMRVAITGSRRASELAHLIRSFGGIPIIAPTVGIETRQDITKEVDRLINTILEERIDYMIFMTGPGVYLFMSSARNLGLDKKLVNALQQVTIVARSLKTKYALDNHGIKTDFVPDENTAEGTAKLLKNHDMINKKVAILWHGSYSPIIRDDLDRAGAKAFELSIYTYSVKLKESGAKILKAMGFNYKTPQEAKVVELVEEVNKGLVDAITFTSPPSAHDLFKIAEAHRMKDSLQLLLNKDVIVVAVGPSTRKALEEEGVQIDVMPNVYKMGSMVKSLSDYVSQTNVPKIRKRS